MALTGAKGLMRWCQQVTESYDNVQITNMTTSWRDGLAFCAILHHFHPDSIDYDRLAKENIAENNHLAFTTAERQFGIPALLDVEDMVSMPVPDKLSIMTYVSQYYSAFKDQVPAGPNQQKQSPPKRPFGWKADVQPAKKQAQEQPPVVPGISAVKEVIGSPPKTSLGRATHLCHSCGKPVYLMERLNAENRVYHRICFKCSVCGSQLRPSQYRYIPSEKKFYCDQHYRSRTVSTNSEDGNNNGITEKPSLPSLVRKFSNGWKSKQEVRAVPPPRPAVPPQSNNSEPYSSANILDYHKSFGATHISTQQDFDIYGAHAQEASVRSHKAVNGGDSPMETTDRDDARSFLSSALTKQLQSKSPSSVPGIPPKTPSTTSVLQTKTPSTTPGTETKAPSATPGMQTKTPSVTTGIQSKTPNTTRGIQTETPSTTTEMHPKIHSMTPGIQTETHRPTPGIPRIKSASPSPMPSDVIKDAVVLRGKKKGSAQFDNPIYGEQIKLTPNKNRYSCPTFSDSEYAEPRIDPGPRLGISSNPFITNDKRHHQAGQGKMKPVSERVEEPEDPHAEIENEGQVEGDSAAMKKKLVLKVKKKKVDGSNHITDDVSGGDEKHHIKALHKSDDLARVNRDVDMQDSNVKRSDNLGTKVEGHGTRVGGLGTRAEGLGTKAEDFGTRSGALGARAGGLGTRTEGLGKVTNETKPPFVRQEEIESVGIIAEHNKSGVNRNEWINVETHEKNRKLIPDNEVNKSWAPTYDRNARNIRGSEIVEVKEEMKHDDGNVGNGKKKKLVLKVKKGKGVNKEQQEAGFRSFLPNETPSGMTSMLEEKSIRSEAEPIKSDVDTKAKSVSGFTSYVPNANDMPLTEKEGARTEDTRRNTNSKGKPLSMPESMPSLSDKSTRVMPFVPKSQTDDKSIKSDRDIKSESQNLNAPTAMCRDKETSYFKTRKAPSPPQRPEPPKFKSTESLDKEYGDYTEGTDVTKRPQRTPPNRPLPPLQSEGRVRSNSSPKAPIPEVPSEVQQKRMKPGRLQHRNSNLVPEDKSLTREEMQMELRQIERSQRELEQRGVAMEKMLREKLHGEPEEEYMIEWFNLVTEKNRLLRRENELIYLCQELDYFQNQKSVESELRELLEKDEGRKTELEKRREEELLQKLVLFVSKRSSIVDKLEEDRVREKEEDEQIEMVMEAQGLSKERRKVQRASTFYC